MPRADYDEIKDKFGQYIRTWKTRQTDILDSIFLPSCKNYLSTSQAADGAQHGLEGIRQFVTNYPVTDILHTAIYNFTCRLRNGEAQMYAAVVCAALDYVENQEEMDCFQFAALISCHWTSCTDGWKIDEMRMDLAPRYGNLRSKFEAVWYFGDDSVNIQEPMHYPCIQGELDSPWIRIPDAEDVLTEEEKIKEVANKRFFSVDHMIMEHGVDAYSSDFAVNIPGSGRIKGRRPILSVIKFNRQRNRYWVHTYCFDKIEIDGDTAKSYGFRTCGQALPQEYIWTRSTVDMEPTCSVNYFEFAKENGEWKITYWDPVVSLGVRGSYSECLFGDKV